MSQQINLFNPVFMKQKKYFSVVAMAQALGLIVLGSVAFYGYGLYEVRQLSRQADEMSARYAAEQKRFINYSNEFALQRTGQMVEEELTQLEAKAKAQEVVLNSLKSGAFGNTSGYSEFMRGFARQSVSGLWLTGFDIVGDGTQMSLSGGVTDPQQVPAYIQRLGREKVMQGKTFATLQMQQPKKDGDRTVPRYVEFNLRSVMPATEVGK